MQALLWNWIQMQGGKGSFLMLGKNIGFWGKLSWQSVAAELGDCFQELVIYESFHCYLGNAQEACVTACSQK